MADSANSYARPREAAAPAGAAQSGPTTPAATSAAPRRRTLRSQDSFVNEFFENFEVRRIFHEDGGVTTFTKHHLAAIVYAAEADEDRDLDRRIKDTTGTVQSELRKERQRIKERRAQFVNRAVKRLQSVDVLIVEVAVDRWPLERAGGSECGVRKDSDLRCSKYNPHAEVAQRLQDLLDDYGISGFEIVGILAKTAFLARPRALLTDMTRKHSKCEAAYGV